MVECTGLENQQSRKVLVGSNPTASASQVPTVRSAWCAWSSVAFVLRSRRSVGGLRAPRA